MTGGACRPAVRERGNTILGTASWTGAPTAPGQPAGALRILRCAISFGIFTGFLEACFRLALQRLGWLTWKWSFVGITLEALWVAPLLNLFLFVGLGCFWVVCNWLLGKRFAILQWALYSFLFLFFLDFLILWGRFTKVASFSLALGLTVVLLRFRNARAKMEGFSAWAAPWAVALLCLSYVGVQGGMRAEEALAVRGRVPAGDLPNVVLIIGDALRADHLSGFGYPRETSPNIDKMIQQGTAFENAVAPSSWTLPSHASLFTGLYPFQHGGVDDYNYKAKDFTIGEKLQSLGYRTGAFSANRTFFTKRWGFDRGFDRFGGTYATLEAKIRRTVFGNEFLDRIGAYFLEYQRHEDAAVVGDLASAWAQQDSSRPFFLTINFYGTHSPYHSPKSYEGVIQGPPPNLEISKLDPRYGPIPDSVKLDFQKLQKDVNGHDRAIRNIDDTLQRLLDDIHRSSSRKTLVIITADHGESFGEHGEEGHKLSLYWEEIRVPIILWGPGLVPEGKRIATPVTLAALPATIMEVLGKPASEFPAASLKPMWQDPPPQKVHWPMSEITQYQFPGTEGTPVFFGAIAAVVTDKWHYIEHEKMGQELYDWKADPKEEHDLSQTPEGQEVCKTLSAYLRELRGGPHK